MAPATDAIMGSVSIDHASVGSAMNDTTRMVGGAFGVAILGSVLAGGYSDQVGTPPRACRPTRSRRPRARSAARGRRRPAPERPRPKR